MHRTYRTYLVLIAAAGLILASLVLSRRHDLLRTPAVAHAAPVDPGAQEIGDRIQIALLLDTSSSMQGLIDQAKTQLWRVVNEFAQAKKNGKRPLLEIALYEYGKSSLSEESGWIRQIVPFTTDLDRISEELFGLGTNGGDEYCGQVIQVATRDLGWSKEKGDLKLIFIAGNEPFTQGRVDFHKAVAAAREAGITVNTIHCGSHDEGIQGGWRDGAVAGGGEFMVIDHNAKALYVAAPQDAEIARLGGELNNTYLAYGAGGGVAMARQEAQDENARTAAPGSMAQRAVAKSSALYDNSGWDLIDGSQKGRVKLDELGEGELPAEMRGMNAAERRAYVDAKAKERGAIQARIRDLEAERQKYVAAEMAKQGQAADNTLDAAVVKTVRGQGAKSGWTF